MLKKIGGYLIRIPVVASRVLFALLIIPLIFGIFAFFQHDSSIPDATWGIQTYYQDYQGNRMPSRVYYGEELLTIGGDPALRGWWEYDGEGYNYHGDIKIFKESDIGKVDIIKVK